LLFVHAFTAAAIAFLPISLSHLLFGIVALKQSVVVVAQASTLLPSSLAAWLPGASEKAAGLLSALDFFKLWSAALLGLGIAAGTKMRRAAALGCGFFLYAVVAALAAAAPGLVS